MGGCFHPPKIFTCLPGAPNPYQFVAVPIGLRSAFKLGATVPRIVGVNTRENRATRCFRVRDNEGITDQHVVERIFIRHVTGGYRYPMFNRWPVNDNPYDVIRCRGVSFIASLMHVVTP